MSLKTDLPYNIDCGTRACINLGQAAGTSWSLEPVFVKIPGMNCDSLASIEIKRADPRGSLTIDVTIIICDSDYDIQLSECIKDGQASTLIELDEPVLHNSKVSGIVTVIKCEENVNFMPNLSSDLICLLNNPHFFPDAILKCDETKIAVHKGILSVRSSVFAAIFKNEIQQDIADIENLEPNVLLAMLKYIYSDKVDNLTDVLAGDLLLAADLYQLHNLKWICIDKLKSSLSVNNVFRALLLGNIHDIGLKDHAKDFVCQCKAFSELEETEDWTSLKRNHPDLAIEVLTTALKYKEKRNLR